MNGVSIMRIEDLPVGNDAKAPLEIPHFPARWQAFVWRNWEQVEPARIAAVLGCGEPEVIQAAVEMGLTSASRVNPKWLTHGYLTLIRNNCHLLPYSQLLKLLDWTPEKMAYTLKEEDFFRIKLGSLKPDCPELKYEVLTLAQKAATARLRESLRKHVSEDGMPYLEPPFAFADQFAPVSLVVARNRFGLCGACQVKFVPQTMQFREFGNESEEA